MHLFDKYRLGLGYAGFLDGYAKADQKERWRQVFERVALTPAQAALLAGFRRSMPVLCLAGTWCGDCVNQCPIFEHFAAAAPVIQVRYLDRDEHADVQAELCINGGNRIPVVVFFSEDGHEVARYGERTLSTYRQKISEHLGPKSSVAPRPDSLLAQVAQDWLNEFERVQWLLQLSPRLRQLHRD